MNSQNKKCIILDTNVIGSYKGESIRCGNYNFLSTSKRLFFSLIRFVEQNSLQDDIIIAVPHIVLDEIMYQQKLSYESELKKIVDKFDKFKQLKGFELKIPSGFDYLKILRDRTDSFTSKHKIQVIDYPDDQVLKKLIHKAINRKKPFYKKKNKDSGFKDAILWESIIKYAKNNKNIDYIFLTEDKDFNDDDLIKEFRSETGEKIFILDSLVKVKELLSEHYSALLQVKRELDFIQKAYKARIRNFIYNYLKNNIKVILINSQQFDVEDFNLEEQPSDLEKNDDSTYTITVPIWVRYKTFYSEYAKLSEIYGMHSEDKEDFSIILNVSIKDEKILINNITFDPSLIDEIKFQPPYNIMT